MRTEIYKDEGYRLMGAAFEVYNEQGCGLAGEIYQEGLEIELELRGIKFRSKQELNCFCKGRALKRKYLPYRFVFGCLVTELKAVSQLFHEHEAPLLKLKSRNRKVSNVAQHAAVTNLHWTTPLP